MRLVLGLLAFASSSCTLVNAFEDPLVVGDWRSAANTSNRMEVELDGGGSARLFYTVNMGPETFEDRFDIEWEQTSSERFRFTMTCRSSTQFAGECSGENFTMSCSIDDDGEDLRCTGDRVWATYPDLNWK
jgi:hypothetical protein